MRTDKDCGCSVYSDGRRIWCDTCRAGRDRIADEAPAMLAALRSVLHDADHYLEEGGLQPISHPSVAAARAILARIDNQE